MLSTFVRSIDFKWKIWWCWVEQHVWTSLSIHTSFCQLPTECRADECFFNHCNYSFANGKLSQCIISKRGDKHIINVRINVTKISPLGSIGLVLYGVIVSCDLLLDHIHICLAIYNHFSIHRLFLTSSSPLSPISAAIWSKWWLNTEVNKFMNAVGVWDGFYLFLAPKMHFWVDVTDFSLLGKLLSCPPVPCSGKDENGWNTDLHLHPPGSHATEAL